MARDGNVGLMEAITGGRGRLLSHLSLLPGLKSTKTITLVITTNISIVHRNGDCERGLLVKREISGAVFYFQDPGCLSRLLPHHCVPLLLLDLRVPGGPGGSAGVQVQGPHHHIHHVPRALYRISRQFSQHQMVRR